MSDGVELRILLTELGRAAKPVLVRSRVESLCVPPLLEDEQRYSSAHNAVMAKAIELAEEQIDA